MFDRRLGHHRFHLFHRDRDRPGPGAVAGAALLGLVCVAPFLPRVGGTLLAWADHLVSGLFA